MVAESLDVKRRDLKTTEDSTRHCPIKDTIQVVQQNLKDSWLSKEKRLLTFSHPRNTTTPDKFQTTDHLLQCTMTPTKHLQPITMRYPLSTTVTTKLQEELNSPPTIPHSQPTTLPHNKATTNPNPVPSNSTSKNQL